MSATLTFIRPETRRQIAMLHEMEAEMTEIYRNNRTNPDMREGSALKDEILALTEQMRQSTLRMCAIARDLAAAMRVLKFTVEAELLTAAAERVTMTVNAN